MESPLARIMEKLDYTRAEMAEELKVPERMIADICAGITVGERAYRALIARFKLEVELEHLIQAQKEFCAATHTTGTGKQLERIERSRGGSEHHR